MLTEDNSKILTLVITGLGRCGTSLAMQILDACGYPCHGEYPSYEVDELNPHLEMDPDILQKLKGKAVKLLDPHLAKEWHNVTFKDCVIIHMERDLKQQALSQIKMAGILFDKWKDKSNRKQIKALMKGLSAENKQCKKAYSEELYRTFTFEELLTKPDYFVEVANCMTGKKINCDVAKLVPKKRTTNNYDGLLELELLGIK